MFTQSAFLLISHKVTLDEIEAALDLEPLARSESEPEGHWAFDNSSLVYPLGGDFEGRIIVDVADEVWNDDPGDPETDPGRFAAWNLGAFGPGAYPGCLGRATQQAWAWKMASAGVRQHKGLIRLRTAWVTGDEENPLPEDYEPTAELLALTEMCATLCDLQQVICYFNPNGESVRIGKFVADAMEHHLLEDELPLDTWTNVRVTKLPGEDEWLSMESVGMGQIRRPDVEAVFKRDSHTLEDMDAFLRDLCFYLSERGNVLGDGDSVDGPNDTQWVVVHVKDPFAPPPRPIIRLVQSGVDLPSRLIVRA
jgi:hypothetical protein